MINKLRFSLLNKRKQIYAIHLYKCLHLTVVDKVDHTSFVRIASLSKKYGVKRWQLNNLIKYPQLAQFDPLQLLFIDARLPIEFATDYRRIIHNNGEINVDEYLLFQRYLFELGFPEEIVAKILNEQ